jgi:hypothetical protein
LNSSRFDASPDRRSATSGFARRIEDYRDGFRECPDNEFRLLPQRLAVTAIDENRATASGVGTIDIAPAIAYQEAPFQVDIMSAGRAEHHSWLGFSAVASLTLAGAGVKADFDIIERRHRRSQGGMHRFDNLPALGPAADIGLVCDDDQNEPSLSQSYASFSYTWVNNEVLEMARREGEAIADHGPIENAVAIQKYSRPRAGYRMLSHFVSDLLSVG